MHIHTNTETCLADHFFSCNLKLLRIALLSYLINVLIHTRSCIQAFPAGPSQELSSVGSFTSDQALYSRTCLAVFHTPQITPLCVAACFHNGLLLTCNNLTCHLFTVKGHFKGCSIWEERRTESKGYT